MQTCTLCLLLICDSWNLRVAKYWRSFLRRSFVLLLHHGLLCLNYLLWGLSKTGFGLSNFVLRHRQLHSSTVVTSAWALLLSCVCRHHLLLLNWLLWTTIADVRLRHFKNYYLKWPKISKTLSVHHLRRAPKTYLLLSMEISKILRETSTKWSRRLTN